MTSEREAPSARTIVETRGPRAIHGRGALGGACVVLGSALWAYLEYAGPARTPLLALALAGVFFGTSATILLAFRASFPFRTERGPRPRTVPTPARHLPVVEQLDLDDRRVRRRFLFLLGAAFTGLVGVVLLPLRSLGGWPKPTLRATAWRRGVLLTTIEGRPLRPADLPPGSSVPVVPRGDVHDSRSIVRLVRLRDATDRGSMLDGVRAFSAVCTHAGCVVSMFRADSAELVCPCHFSVFDADDGRVLQGPASRDLAELPLALDDEGRIVAADELRGPIGPRLGACPPRRGVTRG